MQHKSFMKLLKNADIIYFPEKYRGTVSDYVNMLKDYFNYAFQNLKRRKLRSWLTMLGIFIGIASIVALSL